MRVAILCFAGGIWLVQQQADLLDLPALGWLLAGALVVIALAGGTARRVPPASRVLVAVGVFVLGFVFAASRAQWRLADELPAAHEGRDIAVVGVVSGLPQVFDRGLRFDFDVEQAEVAVPRHISLAWYRGFREDEWHRFREVHPGERWRFTVRLKRPHGNANPFGFDFEGWLFERDIRATGYVRSNVPTQRLEEFVWRFGTLIEAAREKVRDRFQVALPDAPYAGVLVALAVGDQGAIPAEQWQLFSRTGVTHLMSISGLHVTMFASLAYWLAGFAWRRVPGLALRLPAQQAGVLAGWLAAFGYCLLAGFGVPAQRTLYMLTVVGLALWARRTTAPSRVMSLALLGVLLLDPWAMLGAGFWLSFGAVALLFYASSGRVGRGHWLVQWGRAQWAVTLGMIPALLALFQQFSLVSPPANAVAIPLVSGVVTPLVLLAALIPFEPLLWLAHWLVDLLMVLLHWLDSLPGAVWQQAAPPAWAVVAAGLGCLWMLLPKGFPLRWVGAILLLPAVTYAPPRPGQGELRLTVLDVGQGLAVHVQTASRDLLYDTGPQYSDTADSGTRVVLPYLRAIGVQRLDGIVASHRDTDHTGGLQSVLDGLPVNWVSSSLADDDPLRAKPAMHHRCVAGQQWEWDGVRFEVLHPAPADYSDARRQSNDLSCVLKVSAARGSALLAADIEADVETRLAAQPGLLRADTLVVPHHGSRSSSSPAFVAAVEARTVVFPVGYRNRFRHPHADVLARYQTHGADLLRTDRDGAVIITLGNEGKTVVRQREQFRRYWHDR
ncbi:MAG: DNA internalization-related competence protein ComEC/Rec2 [Rhodocyclaceae bacterium]